MITGSGKLTGVRASLLLDRRAEKCKNPSMCYSAMVNQSVKKLGLRYEARIQLDAFEELFEARLQEGSMKVPRAMEMAFQHPESPQEKRIWKSIQAWQDLQQSSAEQELFSLKKRLADAERTLKLKETKSALNEQRIATEKMAKVQQKIKTTRSEPGSDYARIFPHIYSPLITYENGERVIKPFRYLLRPRGQGAEFDRDFNGAYNARRDRLTEVFWWKSVYGRNHGVLVISKFYENVKLADFERRPLAKGELNQNLILEFEPRGLREMLVPCIFDTSQTETGSLHSFALITDEPNPEVKAVGHDRTPIIMKENYLELWLKTPNSVLSTFEPVFTDKQSTYFEHSIAI